MKRRAALPIAAAVLVLATACGGDPTSSGGSSTGPEGDPEETVEVPVSVTGELVDPEGSRLGEATLSDTDNGVQVELDAAGLTTGGHPVGIYEVGVCEPASAAPGGPDDVGDFYSAGDLVEGVDPAGLPSVVVAEETELGRLSALVGGIELRDLLDEDGVAVVIHPATDPTVPMEETLRSRAVCAEITG